jgi:hypothetical protein
LVACTGLRKLFLGARKGGCGPSRKQEILFYNQEPLVALTELEISTPYDRNV